MNKSVSFKILLELFLVVVFLFELGVKYFSVSVYGRENSGRGIENKAGRYSSVPRDYSARNSESSGFQRQADVFISGAVLSLL